MNLRSAVPRFFDTHFKAKVAKLTTFFQVKKNIQSGYFWFKTNILRLKNCDLTPGAKRNSWYFWNFGSSKVTRFDLADFRQPQMIRNRIIRQSVSHFLIKRSQTQPLEKNTLYLVAFSKGVSLHSHHGISLKEFLAINIWRDVVYPLKIFLFLYQQFTLIMLLFERFNQSWAFGVFGPGLL